MLYGKSAEGGVRPPFVGRIMDALLQRSTAIGAADDVDCSGFSGGRCAARTFEPTLPTHGNNNVGPLRAHCPARRVPIRGRIVRAANGRRPLVATPCRDPAMTNRDNVSSV